MTILTGFFGNKVPIDQSLIALIGAHVGAIYGGSYPAILLNIPGTAASAATAMDGHPPTREGRGGQALGLTAVASFVGTLFGTVCLLLLVGVLLLLARSIASPEKALLALFGILICGTLMSEDLVVKGWISGFLGLAMAMAGLDPILSEPRYTFGWPCLPSGVQVVPVLMGAFAIPQILDGLRRGSVAARPPAVGRVVPELRLMRDKLVHIIRSAGIGVGIGALPGVGEDVAGWVSYGVARNVCADGDRFGRGSLDGLIAAETADDAAIGGALIPLLALGIPGSPPAAALLGALGINNVVPGPTIDPGIVTHIVAILMMASCTMALMGLLTARVVVAVLRIPPTLFLPVVLVLVTIGSFSVGGGVNDLYLMLGVGLVATALIAMRCPIAPLVVGVILGGLLDESVRRALLVSGGDLSAFVARPVAAVLLAANALPILSQTPARRLLRLLRRRPA